MSNASRRAARLEERTADVLHTTRVHRKSYRESAPDVAPITLASGLVVMPECKSRAKVPRIIRQALEQAAKYLPDCVPLAVIRQTGGRAVACLWIEDLARVTGIRDPEVPAQPVLPLTVKR